ncbi:conserved hypothetical protein [Crenothrix polyspora]|uniref:Ferritin-like domain-containing protein n=1 Tax=Crenothrix polyspora TaxID=360316 RepID=A0A1R4HJ92_9GAMM|nr:ferritin-like domain-containing protein [Crenothrix polyspora]SJM96289.1 conserved hypothetical protein [Crenothrix polyspora]
MKTVFEYAEACLRSPSIEEKLALTHQAWQCEQSGLLHFDTNSPVMAIADVNFPAKPALLPPRAMPNRKLTTVDGVVAFFHAIAHVEFMAISLAWDLLYRFRGLPEQFYRDWLRVADEEAQHFELLQGHLRTLNVQYGDLPAHNGLWDHAVDTADDLPGRLAMVPRCMEARGLDVTPGIIAKFAAVGDNVAVALLTRILTDEVGHVERGSYWFKFVCSQQGLAPEAHYQTLIKHYYRGGKPKGPFNREMRIIAGFSDTELDWLES